MDDYLATILPVGCNHLLTLPLANPNVVHCLNGLSGSGMQNPLLI